MASPTKCWPRLLTLSLALTLLLLIALVTLTVSWVVKRKAGFENKERTICEPCSSLTSYGDSTIPQGCSRGSDGRCCCRASLVIHKVVKQALDRQFRDYHTHESAAVMKTECTANEKPSGKIAGLDSEKIKEAREDEKETVYFKTQTMNLVPHSNGRFIVKQPGLYYVFSQIKYDHDPESASMSEARQSHTMHKHTSNAGPVKLVENARSFAELQGPENNGTSFIGSVFELKKDDQIMVRSSHTHKLTGNHLDNFFGLYII